MAMPVRMPERKTSSNALVAAPRRKSAAEPQREHEKKQQRQQQLQQVEEEAQTCLENAWFPAGHTLSPIPPSGNAAEHTRKPGSQTSAAVRSRSHKMKGANTRRAAHVLQRSHTYQVPQVFSLGMPAPPCSAELADLLMTYSRALRQVSSARGIERARVHQAAIEVVGRVRMGVRESLVPVTVSLGSGCSNRGRDELGCVSPEDHKE